MIPVTITNVIGAASPQSWRYLVNRAGPSENMAVTLPVEALLAFKINASASRAWRGVGALQAASGGTAELLSELEKQLAAESRFVPARLVSGTMVKDQRDSVKSVIKSGGIITISGGKSGGGESTKALDLGTLKGEHTPAAVTLHEQLSGLISSVLGVPPDLLTGGSEAGSRESFRRMSVTTIASLLEAISIEWTAKIGPLEITMDHLRAGDISARARAIGSRSVAFKNLTSGGVSVDRALVLAGLVDG